MYLVKGDSTKRQFQHTAARRRLLKCIQMSNHLRLFQHTAARRRLQMCDYSFERASKVSTHSRPKAAAPNKVLNIQLREFQHTAARRRLQIYIFYILSRVVFQHTAARRRLPPVKSARLQAADVSTHSRPKAAAARQLKIEEIIKVSTHSRPKAAALAELASGYAYSGFNTQPPEGCCVFWYSVLL